ncbi:universal stress protein [Laceyella putida]|uniref:Universal stress protein n=1 Tax=Laceyella putida TaxID=110101 RepID=A0ABW2RQI1_9BACL
MFRKILLPIDGSEHSKRAVDAAISICKGKNQCRITLLTIQHSLPLWIGEMAFAYAEVETKLEKECNDMLSPFKERIQAEGVVCQSLVIKSSSPAYEIYSIAKDHNFDLIVMGSRGLGKVSELWLGSVSHTVVQQAPCPVLVVK